MNNTALLAGLVTMLCWGSASIFDKVGMRGVANPVVAMVVRMGVATVALAIYATCTGALREVREVPVPNLAALAASALLAAMIGQGAYFVAIKHADASRVVPFTASYPVVALILGILVLHEPLTVPKVAGTALVLCGLMLLAGVFGK